MIKVTVVGAAGRMGRRFVENIVNSDDLELWGALEIDTCPLIGEDAASVACGKSCGVAITAASSGLPAGTEAVITFATSGVIETARSAAAMGASIVIGTTALSKETTDVLAQLACAGARIVQSGNMSVGVNLLFKLVKEAAAFLGIDYNVEIVEMHHNKKLDAPSGTAVRLGEVVCEARNWDYDTAVKNGRSGMVGKRPAEEIGMHALRGGDVVGDHTVIFSAEGERVELSHRASSRDMFARGALLAVEFLLTAPHGLYDMQDVLKLK